MAHSHKLCISLPILVHLLTDMNYKLTNLHKRNDIKFIMVCIRSSTRHLSKMITLLTLTGRDFLTSIAKVQPLTWVNQYETFAINEITGMFHNHELCKDSMKAGHALTSFHPCTLRRYFRLRSCTIPKKEVKHKAIRDGIKQEGGEDENSISV